MQRSYCGLIDLKSVEETLIIKGWVNTRRDHGGVIFIDLRDHTGLVQVVFNPEEREIFEAAQAIRSEYVLEVRGIVKKRLDGTDNPEMSTGKIEIVAKDLTILNTSKKDVITEKKAKIIENTAKWNTYFSENLYMPAIKIIIAIKNKLKISNQIIIILQYKCF